MLRAALLLQQFHLLRNALGGASMKGASVDRLGAPVAPVRAAAAGDQVERKESVRALPCLTIRFQVNQVARRKWQGVEFANQRPRSAAHQVAIRDRKSVV